MDEEMKSDRLLGVSIERVEDTYVTRFTIAGQEMSAVSLTVSDIDRLKSDLRTMVGIVDSVNLLDRCPLCNGFIELKENLPMMPMAMVGGRFQCSSCSLSIKAPKGLDRNSAMDWWNNGRKRF